MSVNVGDKAPAFDLPTDGDGQLKLSSLKGKAVVLFFYPKASTPGCTNEAKDFTALAKEFEKAGAVKRQDNFKAKNDLSMPLLSDEDGTLCEAYGVWVLKKNYGREYMGIERSTFLIDAKGKIAQVWRKVRVKGHAQAVLEAVQAL